MEMNIAANKNICNILPHDGTVNYYGKVLDEELAAYYFECLVKTIEWKNDEGVMFGKHFITKRKVAWYGDRDYDYVYSKSSKKALGWTAELAKLKSFTEELTGTTYNSCLLNLYDTGDEGMGWHSDDEKELEENGSIASISLGVERKFAFRHKKTKEIISLLLENGSLLLMKGTTQTNWLHSLPKSKKIQSSRINLTFRTFCDRSG